MRRALPPLLLGFALSACLPPSVLPSDARERVVRETTHQPRYLRVAVYAGPFFGDSSKVLISDRPAEEVAAAGVNDGALSPAPVFDRVLLPGTALFVEGVQFPTGPALWTRSQSTPRYRPWLIGRTAGEKRALVLLLSPRAATADDLLAEVGRVLTSSDPSSTFRALPDWQRSAIEKKAVVEGMGPEAAAMAWGYPDRIAIDESTRAEEWSWADGLRRAVFQDDRLVRFEAKGAGQPKPGNL